MLNLLGLTQQILNLDGISFVTYVYILFEHYLNLQHLSCIKVSLKKATLKQISKLNINMLTVTTCNFFCYFKVNLVDFIL